jgi:hypothetical protein
VRGFANYFGDIDNALANVSMRDFDFNIINYAFTNVSARGFAIDFGIIVSILNHRLVNLCCVFGPDGELGRHKVLYWFGLNVPTSSLRLLMLPALKFAVGVTNGRERDEIPSLWCA